MSETSIITIIKKHRPLLRKSERHVAAWVLRNASSVPDFSLKVIAERTEVSEPTIVRFCHNIGCQGFQDLKIRLARDTATQRIVRKINREKNLSPVERAQQTAIQNVKSQLTRTQKLFSKTRIEKAASLIVNAKRLVIAAMGESGCIGKLLYYKLSKLTEHVSFSDDPHLQTVQLSLLGKTSVLLLISESGENPALIRHCKLAKTQKAQVIAVCPHESSLAELATVCLFSEKSNVDLYEPLANRLPGMIMLDALFAEVTRQQDDKLARHARKYLDTLEAQNAYEEQPKHKVTQGELW